MTPLLASAITVVEVEPWWLALAAAAAVANAVASAWYELQARRRHRDWKRAAQTLENNLARLGRAVEKVDQDPTRRMSAEECAAVGRRTDGDAP